MSQIQNRQLNRTDLKVRRVTRAFAVLVLMFAPFLVSEAQAATKTAPAPEVAIEGVWMVRTTLRNCVTNAIEGPAFRSLVTFTSDGLTLESSGSAEFAPGQITPGHGTCTRIGRNTYRDRTTALILFGTPPDIYHPGLVPGTMTTTRTVVPVETEKLVSQGTVEYYDSRGKLYRRICTTATGSRLR